MRVAQQLQAVGFRLRHRPLVGEDVAFAGRVGQLERADHTDGSAIVTQAVAILHPVPVEARRRRRHRARPRRATGGTRRTRPRTGRRRDGGLGAGSAAPRSAGDVGPASGARPRRSRRTAARTPRRGRSGRASPSCRDHGNRSRNGHRGRARTRAPRHSNEAVASASIGSGGARSAGGVLRPRRCGVAWRRADRGRRSGDRDAARCGRARRVRHEQFGQHPRRRRGEAWPACRFPRRPTMC